MAYSQEQRKDILNNICELISEGQAIRNVLKLENMPSYSTFYVWIEEDSTKSKQYAQACEARQDKMFEDMLDIADDQENDVYIDQSGNEQVNHNVINRSKLRIETRKWHLSKLNPKKYGERIQQDTNGVVKHDFSAMSLDEVKKAIEAEKKKHD